MKGWILSLHLLTFFIINGDVTEASSSFSKKNNTTSTRYMNGSRSATVSRASLSAALLSSQTITGSNTTKTGVITRPDIPFKVSSLSFFFGAQYLASSACASPNRIKRAIFDPSVLSSGTTSQISSMLSSLNPSQLPSLISNLSPSQLISAVQSLNVSQISSLLQNINSSQATSILKNLNPTQLAALAIANATTLSPKLSTGILTTTSQSPRTSSPLVPISGQSSTSHSPSISSSLPSSSCQQQNPVVVCTRTIEAQNDILSGVSFVNGSKATQLAWACYDKGSFCCEWECCTKKELSAAAVAAIVIGVLLLFTCCICVCALVGFAQKKQQQVATDQRVWAAQPQGNQANYFSGPRVF